MAEPWTRAEVGFRTLYSENVLGRIAQASCRCYLGLQDLQTIHTCCRPGFRIKIGFTKWKLIIKIYFRKDDLTKRKCGVTVNVTLDYHWKSKSQNK